MLPAQWPGAPVAWVAVSTPQHRADRFLDPGSDPREGGPQLGDERAFAEQFTRDHDLGFVGCDSEGDPVSLRELLVHMIEEYARHNGHADLLRERIDGRIGQ